MAVETLLDFAMDCGKIMFAIVCASIIGLERQRLEKAAGLRTHILICLGACLITIVGIACAPADDYGALLRVFQGIITGVGFVGAGAIIQQGGNVKGLTTAVGIWVVAAIGIAIGVGQYGLALVGTLATHIVLHHIGALEWMQKKKDNS